MIIFHIASAFFDNSYLSFIYIERKIIKIFDYFFDNVYLVFLYVEKIYKKYFISLFYALEINFST